NWLQGIEAQPLTPGFHWVLPLVTTTYGFDVKTQALTWKDRDDRAYSSRLVCLTRDGQEVRVEMTLQFRVANAPQVFTTLGTEYIDRIAPITQSMVTSATANFSAQDLYSTQRPALQAQIRENLAAYLQGYGIGVLDVLLRDVQFDKDFVTAIESKTIAENQLLQKRFEIEQARQEARTQVSQAQAEAGILKARADALTRNPRYLAILKSQVLGESLETLVTR
ncbi:MAG: prohibitin family protein, partial [Gloeomargaritaceae cyanobacterium C42_A2020_066]|nr:prohibitin family protein [Gloeomargaritaceae cyanobacterium C42_A2020_066]